MASAHLMTSLRNMLQSPIILIVVMVLVSGWEGKGQESPKQQSVTTASTQQPTAPPSLSGILTQTIVFIYEDKTPAGSPNPVPGRVLGTAFIVGIPLPGHPDQSIPFVVTARHVLADRNTVLVRFTLKTGNPGFAKYDLEQLTKNRDLWTHPNDGGIDLVAFRTPAYKEAKLLAFPLNLIASKETFSSEFITVSDRVMIPCLMENFPGVSQNYPIFRDGSIALIGEEPIPYVWKLGSQLINTSQRVIFINAVINEGFSGAPVFLWPGIRLTSVGNQFGGKPWLLGIVQGFFTQRRQVIDAEGKDVAVAKQEPGLLGQMSPPRQVLVYSQDNSGTGVVFPAWHLAEIFNQEEFSRRIKQLEAEDIKNKDKKKN